MAFLSKDPNNPQPKNANKVQKPPEIFSINPPSSSTNRYIIEPMGEGREAYDSQLLIPVRYGGKMYAMSGPLSSCAENPLKNGAFFPTHPRLKPIGCAKKPRADAEDATPANQQHPQTTDDINLQFMNKRNQIFRSSPNFSSEYSEWLNKMERVQASVWKEMGIYDLVMLSKTGLPYCPLCWCPYCTSGIVHISIFIFLVG